MRIRALLGAASLSYAIIGVARAKGPSPSPSPELKANAGASFSQRLAAAKSAKVRDSILGIELGMEMDEVASKLDKVSDPRQSRKKEKEEPDEREEQHKALWQLVGTDYSAVLLTSDKHERVISIDGYLRPGKEIAFSEIGRLTEAPVQTEQMMAWDVLRPNHPLFRVVARGDKGKARRITIGVVERSRRPD